MNTICPFCQSNNVDKLKDITSPFNQKNYELINCYDCYLQFFTPLIFEQEIYEAEINQQYIDFHKGRRFFPAWTNEMIRVIKKLKINLNDKTILEIGAGDGINYTALNEISHIKPINYYAIELDSKSIEQCRLKGITNIVHSIFNEAIVSSINKKFGIILILEVFEHQTNPRKFIKWVFDLLNSDGLIIMTVPNRERYFIKYDKELGKMGDFPPHHFLRFNRSFFLRNFNNRLYYLKDYYTGSKYNKFKNVKESALKLVSVFKMNKRLWILVAPFVPVIRYMIDIFDKIVGGGIIIVLKNDK